MSEKQQSTNQTTTTKIITSMDDLMKQYADKIFIPKKGEVVHGVLVEKGKKMFKFDIGAKTEGVLIDKEYDFAKEILKDYEIGQKVDIDMVVMSFDSNNGRYLLSLKSTSSNAKWNFFEKALKEKTVLKARAIEFNRGGVIVSVNGVRGFVPSSQFGRAYVGKLNTLKGKTFDVVAIEVSKEKNRLIFSERYVSEASQLARRDDALKIVKEGDVYEGIVSGVMPFGLFVTVEVPVPVKSDKKASESDDKSQDKEQSKEKQTKTEIGYVEGLIHISEISWKKVNDPKDYHKVGDRIKVKVLGVDRQNGKLNLSIKQLQEDPWLDISDKYPPGTTFTGVISRIEPFGVFVSVKSGVDGLIHSSKLKGDEDLKVGDKVAVNVESVDIENRRMSLSLIKTDETPLYK